MTARQRDRRRRGSWAGWLAPCLLWNACSACGPAVPRIVDDARTGRAVYIEEEKTPERLQLSPSGQLLLMYSGPNGHDDHGAARVLDARSLRLLWQAEVAKGRVLKTRRLQSSLSRRGSSIGVN